MTATALESRHYLLYERKMVSGWILEYIQHISLLVGIVPVVLY